MLHRNLSGSPPFFPCMKRVDFAHIVLLETDLDFTVGIPDSGIDRPKEKLRTHCWDGSSWGLQSIRFLSASTLSVFIRFNAKPIDSEGYGQQTVCANVQTGQAGTEPGPTKPSGNATFKRMKRRAGLCAGRQWHDKPTLMQTLRVDIKNADRERQLKIQGQAPLVAMQFHGALDDVLVADSSSRICIWDKQLVNLNIEKCRIHFLQCEIENTRKGQFLSLANHSLLNPAAQAVKPFIQLGLK